MRARLHSIHSSDIDDLDGWTPASADFAVPVRLSVGPDPGSGEESFDVVICSVEWLASQVARDGIVDGRHHFVVEGFDWPKLRHYFQRRAEACSGDSWHEIAEQLARIGYWELESYRP